jgi:hypothetical protein
VQELQVRERLLLGAPAPVHDALDDVAPHVLVHARVGLGVTPAQVGVDDLAREVVRERSVRPAIHGRQAARPLEQLAVVADGGAQEPGRGEAGVGRELEREPVPPARDAREEARHQPPDDVGDLGQLQREASRGSPSRRASSALNAGGDGSIARMSTCTASRPAAAAASAIPASSVVLPTPPTPWIHSTLNGGCGAASAPRNSPSSASRPTNRRRRAPRKTISHRRQEPHGEPNGAVARTPAVTIGCLDAC